MPTPWTSNATAADIVDFLRDRRRIVVLTHLKPDGDAVGSTLAMVRALNASDPKRAQTWHAPPLPPWFGGIVGDTPARVLGKEGPPADFDPDAVVVVDTGSWSQLEHVRDWLSWRRDSTVVIDHHVQGDAGVASRRFIDTTAASACQPVAEVCRLMLGVPGVAQLPPRIAEALYLGVASDTGWFRHSNVSHRVMSIAGELLDAGADHVRLYQATEQRESVSRLRLMARALESLELLDADRLAVMNLNVSDFRQCRADAGESGGFVDLPQQIESVRVSAMLTEVEASDYGKPSGPMTKVSMRSKEGAKAVDVNAVMKALGGGGHVRAAGARVPMTMAQTKAEIVRLVQEQTSAW